MKKALLVLFVISMALTSLFAFDGYIEVTNNTGYDIYYLYVSSADADDWGDDRLGNDILEDGDSIIIDDLDGKSSIFDVHAEDEDGDTYTQWELDLEYEDWEITLNDLD